MCISSDPAVAVARRASRGVAVFRRRRARGGWHIECFASVHMNAIAGQHELNKGKNGVPDEQAAMRGGAIGKSTLSQGLDAGDGGAASPPLFSAPPRWEPIDPIDEQLGHLNAEDGAGDDADHADGESSAEPPAEQASHEAEGKSAAAAADDAAPASLASAAVHEPDDDEDGDEPDAAGARLAAAPDAGADADADAEPQATAAQAAPAPAPAPAAAATPAAPAAPKPKSKHDKPPNTRAHGKPYERPVAENRHLAKTDKYNVRSIKSNKTSPKRPGPQKEYSVNRSKDPDGKGVKRYRIVRGKQTKAVDRILINHTLPPDQDPKVALNASQTTMLTVEGKTERCVLVWYGVQGSAWIPISSLADSAKEAKEIQRSVDKLAKKWGPAIAPTKGARRFKFRPSNDPVAKPDTYDQTHYILGHQSGTGNNVEDYLRRFAPRSDGTGRERYYYNVCMNLPQGDAPPVANDIANPGDVFFVAKGSTFRREISIFDKVDKTDPNPQTSTRRQTWVYGFIGKRHGGKWVPDTTRCGWVPLRVLHGWS